MTRFMDAWAFVQDSRSVGFCVRVSVLRAFRVRAAQASCSKMLWSSRLFGIRRAKAFRTTFRQLCYLKVWGCQAFIRVVEPCLHLAVGLSVKGPSLSPASAAGVKIC